MHLVEACQSTTEEDTSNEYHMVHGKGRIRFHLPVNKEPSSSIGNKTATKWRKRINRRRIRKMMNTEATQFHMHNLEQTLAIADETIANCTNDVVDTWYEHVFGSTDGNARVNEGHNMVPENTGIFDTGCTSGVTTTKDTKLMNPTGRQSNKIFHMPLGDAAPATEVYELKHDLRQPAREMNVLPNLHSTLISGVKLADAGYVSVLDEKTVNIYDSTTTSVKANGPPILQGWRVGNLWRIPLVPNVTNVNTQTNIVECPPTKEAIANVFELPSVEKLIAYFHAAAGYPIMSTWLKAIDKGNFATWPGLTSKAVRKYYPETDATMAGHMHGIRQGIKSTKARDAKLAEETNATTEPVKKEHDIMVKVVDLQETMYTDQTGMFPYLSSRGNRYIMVAIHIDAN